MILASRSRVDCVVNWTFTAPELNFFFQSFFQKQKKRTRAALDYLNIELALFALFGGELMTSASTLESRHSENFRFRKPLLPMDPSFTE